MRTRTWIHYAMRSGSLLLVWVGLAAAQATPPQELPLWLRTCREAQTPELCRSALPSCDSAAADLRKQPAGRDKDRQLAEVLSSSANCLDEIGQYAQAEQHYRMLHEILVRLHGPASQEVATSLLGLGEVLSRQGKYAEAEELFRRILDRNTASSADTPTDNTRVLNNLATTLNDQGKYEQAEPLLRQALALRRRLFGDEHPSVASSLSNLAITLANQGKAADAETLNRQALALRRRLHGELHLAVASSLRGLAIQLSAQGVYAEAEELLRDALAIRIELQGKEHPDVAGALHSLAGVLVLRNQYSEAERLHRQALLLRQKLLADSHPDIARSLDGLGSVLLMQGRFAEAEGQYRQALRVYTGRLGDTHPLVATCLNNLAKALAARTHYAEAEELSRRALDIRRALLGPEHPHYATSLASLVQLYLSRAAIEPAVPLLREVVLIRDQEIRTVASEARARSMLADTVFRFDEDATYSLLLSPHSADAERLAMQVALLRKGRVAEAGVVANRLLHRNLKDAALTARFAEWQAVRAQREQLLYAGAGALAAGVYQARLKELGLQADSLEYLLAAKLPGIRRAQPPSLESIVRAVADRLQRDGVLIEIVWSRQFHPAKPSPERWGPAHYIALLLFPDRRIVSHDLGEAALLDTEIHALRAVLATPGSNPLPAARALYERTLGPLQAALAGQTRLYLSLDGALQLVPFAALHDGKDYLIERYRIHYLTSGRDLLRQPSAELGHEPLLLAHPDLGGVGRGADSGGPRTVYQGLADLSALPGSEREARAIAHLLQTAPLIGPAATEASVRSRSGPRILHIASHSLFLDEAQLTAGGSSGVEKDYGPSTPRSQLLPLHDAAAQDKAARPQVHKGSELSRSALVLAGAARGDGAKDPQEDGLLTAEEARSLDLDGTQLVVLSACDTGQGALTIGQGVYGLRRAFLVAGAETLVTSLWRIDDQATGELMLSYYQKLLDKVQPRDRVGGMQEAMQDLRRRPGRAHPAYWAAFQVIGMAGPLRSTPMR